MPKKAKVEPVVEKSAETAEVCTLKPVEEKSKKQMKKDRFKFSDEESARIWYAPYGGLSKSEHHFKKLLAYGFFYQKEPAVIRDNGHNETCVCCNTTVMDYAKLHWNDRNREGETKPYTLKVVCVKCLDKANIQRIYDHQVVSLMVKKDLDMRFRSVGDAKGHICEVCFEDDGQDATYLNVPIKNFLLPVAVCQKHLEFFCKLDVAGDNRIDEFVATDEIPLIWSEKIKAFNAFQHKEVV